MNTNPPLFPVSLVGAGPGDPDLLTLGAWRRLQHADVLLCDELVDARVLALARPGARLVFVGKRGGRPSTEQRFIHELMIREARSGLRVVRLKGGDPYVFGRGGEEVDALRAAGIAVEVVSGVTAGIAAPASIGIPVTDRRHAPGVAFVTGRCRHSVNGDGGPSEPNWTALVQSGLTLVIYMGLHKVDQLVESLMQAGMAPQTLAAAISSAHTPQQHSLVCTLDSLGRSICEQGLRSPAILVLGAVVAQANPVSIALQHPMLQQA